MIFGFKLDRSWLTIMPSGAFGFTADFNDAFMVWGEHNADLFLKSVEARLGKHIDVELELIEIASEVAVNVV